MSKSKSKTTSNQTTNQTATTTPNTPAWLQQPWQQYTGQVQDLMNNGGSLVAGPSALQQQAFAGAANLGQPQFSWQAGGQSPQVMPTSAGPSTGKPSTMDTGPQVMPVSAGPSTKTTPDAGPQVLPTSAGPGGTTTAGTTTPAGTTAGTTGGGMGAYDLAGLLGYQAGTAGANTAGWTGYNPAGQAATTGYTAQGYNPAQATTTNATAANAGQAQTYNPTTYNAQTGQASTYNPAMLDLSGIGIGATQVSGIGRASSRNITDLNLNDYLNAGLGDQITAAQADYDAYNGAARAGLSASAAANGGARNSNNAIRAAVQEGELSRATNTGLANIRANAYDQAGNLATSDLNRSAQVSMANASNQTQGALAQAQIDANRASQLAGMQFQGAQGNQNAANQAGQFNAGQQNAMTQTNLGYQNQAAANNANAQNAASQWNAGAANDFALTNAGFNQQANLQNANAANANSQFNAQQANAAGAFGADAANAANQFGANAWNNASMDYTGRQDAAGQFNANAFNQNQQFNAGQGDNALARQLQAAGLLGSLGSQMSADNRANIALQGELGGIQREIENAQLSGDYARLAMLSQLLGQVPSNLFVGNTSTMNGTQSGSSTTNQSGFSMGWSPTSGFSFGG